MSRLLVRVWRFSANCFNFLVIGGTEAILYSPGRHLERNWPDFSIQRAEILMDSVEEFPTWEWLGHEYGNGFAIKSVSRFPISGKTEIWSVFRMSNHSNWSRVFHEMQGGFCGIWQILCRSSSHKKYDKVIHSFWYYRNLLPKNETQSIRDSCYFIVVNALKKK